MTLLLDVLEGGELGNLIFSKIGPILELSME
jgi:hypothetical protein